MIQPVATQIQHAAEILRNGGIIVYPTETVYGIGCDPLNGEAFGKVLFIKQRESSKTMLLLAETLEMVENMSGKLNVLERSIAHHFWPGPLTMIIKPSKKLPAYLLGPTGGIGFRVTSHKLAASIIHKFGRPIISTSANISGCPQCETYEQAYHEFNQKADLVIKNSEPFSGEPSTIIDVTSEKIVIIRQGGIAASKIQEVADNGLAH
jgi:L-threonylcarbamoyladenylate synthase